MSGGREHPMTQTFTHPWWKRQVVVDEGGISERRAGVLAVFIPWEQLERLGTNGVRSDSGSRIFLRLTPARRREFFRFASNVWQQRHPERWQRNQDRIRRNSDRAAYLWLPLFMFGPCVAGYLLLWLLNWPENLQKESRNLNRLTIIGGVFIAVFWIWYAYTMRRRKVVGRDVVENPHFTDH
jgi:hypothetical protein